MTRKAQTSMTRGGLRKLYAGKLRADFLHPNFKFGGQDLIQVS